VILALLDPPDPLGNRVLLVRQVLQELLVEPGRLAPRAMLVLLVRLDIEATQEHLGIKGHQVLKGHQATQETKVQPVHLATLEHQDEMVFLEHLEI